MKHLKQLLNKNYHGLIHSDKIPTTISDLKNWNALLTETRNGIMMQLPTPESATRNHSPHTSHIPQITTSELNKLPQLKVMVKVQDGLIHSEKNSTTTLDHRNWNALPIEIENGTMMLPLTLVHAHWSPLPHTSHIPQITTSELSKLPHPKVKELDGLIHSGKISTMTLDLKNWNAWLTETRSGIMMLPPTLELATRNLSPHTSHTLQTTILEPKLMEKVQDGPIHSDSTPTTILDPRSWSASLTETLSGTTMEPLTLDPALRILTVHTSHSPQRMTLELNKTPPLQKNEIGKILNYSYLRYKEQIFQF